jgi:regulator of ribonuclease activity A
VARLVATALAGPHAVGVGRGVTGKRKGGRPVGETLGGILAGFDQQIMRNQPPPHELVHKGAPVRGLAGDDPGDFTITLRESVDDGVPRTTDLLDADPEAYDVCELPLPQFGGVRRFSGRVRTVRCHEDNVLARRVLETPGHGQVLVLDGGGSTRTALLGDQVAGLAAANGWAGIIVNGCVRDVEALARVPLGIRALGLSPRRSGKAGTGVSDVPVQFGRATFRPGATVVSDDDGVIVTRSDAPAQDRA